MTHTRYQTISFTIYLHHFLAFLSFVLLGCGLFRYCYFAFKLCKMLQVSKLVTNNLFGLMLVSFRQTDICTVQETTSSS